MTSKTGSEKTLVRRVNVDLKGWNNFLGFIFVHMSKNDNFAWNNFGRIAGITLENAGITSCDFIGFQVKVKFRQKTKPHLRGVWFQICSILLLE